MPMPEDQRIEDEEDDDTLAAPWDMGWAYDLESDEEEDGDE